MSGKSFLKRILHPLIILYAQIFLGNRQSSISFFKSLYWTISSKGAIILSKPSRIFARPINFQFLNNRSSLTLGLHFYSPVCSTVIRCHPQAKFIINGTVSLFKGVQICVCDKGVLSIGNNTYIEESRIQCRDRISIGNECAIAWGCQILDTDEHNLIFLDNNSINISHAPVEIGNHVWIGNNSIILKGVTIGDNSIIAAGSVVTHNIPANSIAGGIPAKIIRSNVDWK